MSWLSFKFHYTVQKYQLILYFPQIFDFQFLLIVKLVFGFKKLLFTLFN
jgi:hypothetical protein